MTAIQEVLEAAAKRPAGGRPARLERQLEHHREFAQDALKAAQRELDRLVEQLQDDDYWVSHARTWTGHAGYSNGIQGYVSTAYVHLATVQGIVEGVV